MIPCALNGSFSTDPRFGCKPPLGGAIRLPNFSQLQNGEFVKVDAKINEKKKKKK